MKCLEIQAADGVDIPLTWFPAASAKHVLLFLPALGIESRLYETLAAQLAELGCSVCLMEQRGQGRSKLRPSYRVDIGMWDYLDQDIPACLAWLRDECPGLPIIMGGHSLGGHLCTLYSGIEPSQIQGVAHLTCAFPYYRDFSPLKAWQIRFLCFLIPFCRLFPGYFPGALIGFAGRESSRLMMQWRHSALKGDFDFDPGRPLSGAVSNFQGPVISIAIEKDDYASKLGIQRSLSLFRPEQVSRFTLGQAEQGDALGHFKWARQPGGVARCLSDWMNEKISPSETAG